MRFTKYITKPNFDLSLFKILYENNIRYYIAGGSALTLAQRSADIDSMFSDIDVYFYTKEDYQKAREITNSYIDKKEEKKLSGDLLFEIVNCYLAYSNERLDCFYIDGQEVQYIKMNFGSSEKITDEFDLYNSRYWSFYPFEEVYTKQKKDTLYNIKTKKYNNFFTLQRVKKYQVNKHIDPSNIFKNIVETVQNKNIDLNKDNTNYRNTDSASNMNLQYFMMFIENPHYIEEINNSNIDFEWLMKDIHVLYLQDGMQHLYSPLLFYLALQNHNSIPDTITKDDIEINKQKMLAQYPEYLL